MGCFISNQHTKMGLDRNLNVTDGIYNIKGRSTLHVLVANYMNNTTRNPLTVVPIVSITVLPNLP